MKQQFKRRPIALFCGALFAFGIHTSAFAQNSQNTVIVTGSRFEENLNEVPANVQVITRDEIANSTSSNIPDVLSQIGGLNVRSTNPGQLNLDATVDMGGYGVGANSTTLILVDGQRINSIDSTSISWESIPIDSIDRIEVLQGGASVQYGNGAVGGVINIITNGNTSKLNQASVSYGSFGTLVNNAILRDSFEDTTYQLTANTSNTQGWRQNSAANAYAFDAKITQKFGGIDKIYTDFFYGYTNAQNPGGVVGQVGEGNPQSAKFNNIGSNTTTNNTGVRFGGTKGLGEGYIGELDASYTNRTVFYYNPFYDSDAALNVTPYPIVGASNSNLSGWQLNLTPRLKADLGLLGTGIVGYELNKAGQGGTNAFGSAATNILTQDYYISNPNGLPYNSQHASVLNQSFYAILKLPITKELSLDGGARHQTQQASTYDSNIYSPNGAVTADQTYSANAGDVALNFNYAGKQKVYVKWNQSYRFPNIDEFWGFDPNTYNRVFNGILRPQIAQTYEVGGNWIWSSVRVNGSIFSSSSQNEIMYDPSSGLNYNSQYNVNRRGVAMDTSSNITNRLSLAGGGKFQHSYYADGPYAGNAIPVAPNLLLNARASYLIDENWSVGGVVNYVSSQHYDASQIYYSSLALMPSYTAGDVYLNYKTGNFDAKFTIKNVGNASYASYGGYTNVMAANGTFSNNYYYYPSDGRAFYITGKYNF